MKKVFVAIFALLVTVFTVKAQVFVGGGLGLNIIDGNSSLDNSLKVSGTNFGFNISPQVGYYLNGDWAIGIKGYLYNSWHNSKGIYADESINDQTNKFFSNRWKVNVFGRYKLMGLGTEKLSLLVEG
jgi:hypothetical protein